MRKILNYRGPRRVVAEGAMILSALTVVARTPDFQFDCDLPMECVGEAHPEPQEGTVLAFNNDGFWAGMVAGIANRLSEKSTIPAMKKTYEGVVHDLLSEAPEDILNHWNPRSVMGWIAKHMSQHFEGGRIPAEDAQQIMIEASTILPGLHARLRDEPSLKEFAFKLYPQGASVNEFIEDLLDLLQIFHTSGTYETQYAETPYLKDRALLLALYEKKSIDAETMKGSFFEVAKYAGIKPGTIMEALRRTFAAYCVENGTHATETSFSDLIKPGQQVGNHEDAMAIFNKALGVARQTADSEPKMQTEVENPREFDYLVEVIPLMNA